MFKKYLSQSRYELLLKICGNPEIFLRNLVKSTLLTSAYIDPEQNNVYFKILKTPIEEPFIMDETILGLHRAMSSTLIMSVLLFLYGIFNNVGNFDLFCG